MSEIKPEQWDVWMANFPYEEEDGRFSRRPLIILSCDPVIVLAVKVTKHEKRVWDSYDVEIEHWREAGLSLPSTARVAKTDVIPVSNLHDYKGHLQDDDIIRIYTKFKMFLSELDIDTPRGARITGIFTKDDYAGT